MMTQHSSTSSFTPPYADIELPVVVPNAVSSDSAQSVDVDARTEVNTIRALHVINGQHFSGAERVQSHLARRLPEFAVEIDFACLTPDLFPKQFDVLTSTLYDVSMSSRYDIGAARRVAKIAADGNFDLLHAHTPRSAMIAALASKLSGIPWIYHVHSPAASDSTRMLQNRLNHWIEKQSLRSVAHQICVSNSLHSRTVACGHAEEEVTVVHNGVPGERPLRDKFPEVGGTWTLGIIALHRPRKGLEVLLEALKQSRDAGHDVKVRCIGPFETQAYRAEIQLQIEELQLHDHVEFVGFVSDVPAALAELDAMVLPSLFGEGLPMVVLEAMAAAVPVIATRVEGTPEAIRHECEGLLAEAGDPDTLSQQMNRLVTGEVDWHELAESAFNRHAAEFSDRAMARGVADVYRRVLESK